MERDPKKILVEFAQVVEGVLGTEDFLDLLERLTKFAKEEPGAIEELQAEVNANRETFDEILTGKSISELKTLIVAAKTGNIMGLLSGF